MTLPAPGRPPRQTSCIPAETGGSYPHDSLHVKRAYVHSLIFADCHFDAPAEARAMRPPGVAGAANYQGPAVAGSPPRPLPRRPDRPRFHGHAPSANSVRRITRPKRPAGRAAKAGSREIRACSDSKHTLAYCCSRRRPTGARARPATGPDPGKEKQGNRTGPEESTGGPRGEE